MLSTIVTSQQNQPRTMKTVDSLLLVPMHAHKISVHTEQLSIDVMNKDGTFLVYVHQLKEMHDSRNRCTIPH